MLCEMEEVPLSSIESQMSRVHCSRLHTKRHNIGERFQAYALQLFEDIQDLLKAKLQGNVLLQVVVPIQTEQPLYAGLAGLLKTAHLENPQFVGQIIAMEPGQDAVGIATKLEENSHVPHDCRIRYQDGQRYVVGWSEVQAVPKTSDLPWKDQGVYLITGGVGALGLLFAREIARHVETGTLVLTGRSRLDEEHAARCKEIEAEAPGLSVVYRQVDVTDERAVINLVQSVCEESGHIDGIIHSAGIIRDSFIIKKSQEQFLEVLAPKVRGLVNLDQASRELNLDFLICFSSIAGELGNAGQADYATANAFMDAYAQYRNMLVAQRRRRGQTLSINWPLWKSGGLGVDGETEDIMKQRMGMVAMQDSSGMRAFYQSIASGQDQIMVMEGHRVRLREFLGLFPRKTETETEPLSFEDCLELSKKIAEGDLTEEQLMEILVATMQGESHYGL